MISALHALAAHGAIDRLSDRDLEMLALDESASLRPDQVVPRGTWRSYGYLTGRGWGKTHAIAVELHRRVYAGECTAPVLVAPTTDRVREVQASALVASALPWCGCELYRSGVRWENGVVAEAATAEVERPSSGSNYDLAWLTEIVRWRESTMRAAFDDITTACRAGGQPQYLWDSTSSGRNDLIQHLLAQHDADPDAHRIVRGSMFGNPILTRGYLVDEARKYAIGTRRYDEEVLGMAFADAGGALWDADWIDTYRVSSPPAHVVTCVLGLDPALSGDRYSDEVGIVLAYLGDDGHAYVEDYSGRMSPEEYARIVVRECQRDVAGVVVERNHVGQHARDLIRVHARLAGLRVEMLPADRRTPSRRAGTIYVREVVTHSAKSTRAAPVSALYHAGRVHHIGEQPRLEHEQTTWEPGRRSPNRIDACVFAVGELLGVELPTPRDTPRDVEAAAQVRRRGRPRQVTQGRRRYGL